MSTNAQAIIEKIKALPSDEQREVLDGIEEIQSRQRAWDEQKARLREMQGRHAGRGLLKRLLEERAKERARG